MEVPPRVDVLLSRAVEQERAEQRSLRASMDALERRLRALEESVSVVDARLDNWSDPGQLATAISSLEAELASGVSRLHKRINSLALTLADDVRAALVDEFDRMADTLRRRRAS